MALSIQQLLNPPTRQETADWLKQTLTDLGLATTGWQPSRMQLQMLNAFASLTSGAGELAANLARNGFNSFASGAGLTLYALNRFDNTQDVAQKAQGPMTFTNSSTTPYVQAAGAIVLTDSLGVRFQNFEDVTIPGSGAVDVEMIAQLAGASGNIGNGATLTLVTPLAGVVVTNPGPGGGVAWSTTRTGADPEADSELQQRNATKWGTLSVDKSETAVINLALAQDGVAKATVIANNPRGPNTVDVYVSGADALISPAQLAAAQDDFADKTFGTSTSPVVNEPYQSVFVLYDPTPLELLIEGIVYFDPAFDQATVEANLSARLSAFVQSIPIGGETYSNAVGATNVVTIGSIFEVIEGTIGVRSATLDTPSGNIPLGTTTLLTSPSDWITGRLTMVASDT